MSVPERSTAFDRGLALLVRHRLAWLPHTGATLLEHLVGTHDLLKTWEMDEPVALAGLFHSAYGSRGADHALWSESDRSVLRQAIGHDAEELTWRYAGTALSELIVEYNSTQKKCSGVDFGLLHISIANFLDQHQRVPERLQEDHRLVLGSCTKHLVPAAATQLCRVLSDLKRM